MKKLSLQRVSFTEAEQLTTEEKKALVGGIQWICYCDKTPNSPNSEGYCFDITYDHLAPDC